MKDSHFNRLLVVLILASFLIFTAAVVLRVGIGATPYDATDSAGRRMGFNDVLHAEHYAIIIRNFTPTVLLKPEYAYEWALCAAHLIGAGLLLLNSRASIRVVRWFFAVQPILFPFGVLGLPFLPFIVANVVTEMDREAFVDVPFIWFVSHPVWVLAALFITFVLRGDGLGLARVWSALGQGTRAGARTFVNAIR